MSPPFHSPRPSPRQPIEPFVCCARGGPSPSDCISPPGSRPSSATFFRAITVGAWAHGKNGLGTRPWYSSNKGVGSPFLAQVLSPEANRAACLGKHLRAHQHTPQGWCKFSLSVLLAVWVQNWTTRVLIVTSLLPLSPPLSPPSQPHLLPPCEISGPCLTLTPPHIFPSPPADHCTSPRPGSRKGPLVPDVRPMELHSL